MKCNKTFRADLSDCQTNGHLDRQSDTQTDRLNVLHNKLERRNLEKAIAIGIANNN